MAVIMQVKLIIIHLIAAGKKKKICTFLYKNIQISVIDSYNSEWPVVFPLSLACILKVKHCISQELLSQKYLLCFLGVGTEE